jgi:hypothetical protein
LQKCYWSSLGKLLPPLAIPRTIKADLIQISALVEFHGKRQI